MKRVSALCLVALCVVLSFNARADVVAIGIVSFDSLVPGGPGAPGVNGFTISNFTGAFALPPDLPVVSDLSFSGSLTLDGNPVSYGDVGPGSVNPPALQFADFVTFGEVDFSGTLDSTLATLYTGPTVTLLPDLFAGPLFNPVAGVDFMVIYAETAPPGTQVPEPATLFLLGTGLIGIRSVTRRKL